MGNLVSFVIYPVFWNVNLRDFEKFYVAAHPKSMITIRMYSSEILELLLFNAKLWKISSSLLFFSSLDL